MSKEVRINVRATQETKEKLEKICEIEHRSQAEQIAYWITTYKLKEESPR